MTLSPPRKGEKGKFKTPTHSYVRLLYRQGLSLRKTAQRINKLYYINILMSIIRRHNIAKVIYKLNLKIIANYTLVISPRSDKVY